jgi:predicted metal-dependent HD superfamily phosphohydrolase
MNDPSLPSANRAQLAQSWHQLLAPFGAAREDIDRAFDDLAAAYSAAGRHYHTLQHLRHVLDTVAELRTEVADPLAVELAAWFHDVVYDPKASDNEERSAAQAAIVLTALRVPAATIDTVQRLILATKTHQAAPDDRDCQVLLDADLAILGADPATYSRYAEAIRREYAWVPEDQFWTRRRRVLEQFLKRPRIYWTVRMFQTLEQRARDNLRHEIAGLQGERRT